MTFARRSFLGGAVATGLSSLLGNRVCQALDRGRPSGSFKRCLVLWMEGGPSQLDTFDPKSVQGSRAAINTNVPEIRFADSLPGLARRADQLCVLRSIGSKEGEHVRATELLHTGFAPIPSFPRPALGSMVSHARPDEGVPRYVTLGGTGFGPAFLGGQHGPFVIESIDAAHNQLRVVDRKRKSLDLLTEFNRGFSQSQPSWQQKRRDAAIRSVRGLLDTGFTDSLDLDQSDARVRQRYGDHTFGQRLLTARRLLQLGVPFVEAQLAGWDTHIDNRRRTDRLCQSLEKPWIALMDDLQSAGLADDTLIIWMGEFGRTPRLNGQAGRDHFPEATPVVLSGGNLGGRIIGQTNDDGSQRIGTKHSIADLIATVLSLMGLDPDAPYTTDFGSPTTATDGGSVIAEIAKLA